MRTPRGAPKRCYSVSAPRRTWQIKQARHLWLWSKIMPEFLTLLIQMPRFLFDEVVREYP